MFSIKFEKDGISPKLFRAKILKMFDFLLKDQAFDEGLGDLHLDIYRGIDNVLANLKYNYHLVALTNINSIHSKHRTRNMPAHYGIFKRYSVLMNSKKENPTRKRTE